MPDADELISACRDICSTRLDWHRLIKAGTGIRIPREFLDRRQTHANITFLMKNAEHSRVPTYLLLRTYDVCFANEAIRQMLAFDSELFADWVFKRGLNILCAMIDPNDPLYPIVSRERGLHEHLVRTNIVWFVKDNEMFFRHPQILKAAAAAPEFLNQCPPTGVADEIGIYMKRMEEILTKLKANQWADSILTDIPSHLDIGTEYTPIEQPFQMVNAAGKTIYLRPETGSPIAADFFPQVITYQHYLRKNLLK
jgi:hypothetical protein